MGKKIFIVLGVIEFLFARRIVQYAEFVAFENPGQVPLRSWTIPMARLEGMLFVLLGTRKEVALRILRPLLLLIGLVAFLKPRALLDASLDLCYTDADSIQPKPWVQPLTRAVGVFYLILAYKGTKTS